MALNLEMIGRRIELEPFVYDEDDVIFYALSVGAGVDELDFIYEKNLKVLPTFAILPFMVGIREFKLKAGVHMHHTLQLGHELTIRRTIPAAGRIHSTAVWSAAYDKGDKGAVLHIDVESADETGRPLFSNRFVAMDRKGGHFDGGDPGPAVTLPALPEDRPPEFRAEQQTGIQQAALYRLNGDKNPLHIDPAYSRIQGFERPILHGLCACGFVARAVVLQLCGGDPGRFKSFACRFRNPSFPGDLLVTEGWRMGGERVGMRTRTPDGRTVLDHVAVELADRPLP